MTNPNMEADKMLDVYIYDYLVKRKFAASARAFQAEANVPTNRTAIDAPGGFLLEWWSIFWDIFIARFRCPVPGTSGSQNEIVMQKAQEQYQQHQNVEQQQFQQMQLQQLLLQKQIEQQAQKQREEARFEYGTDSETHSRQSLGATNAIIKSKAPSSGSNKKKSVQSRSRENAGRSLVQSNSSILRSGTIGDQTSRQILQGTPGGNFKYFPAKEQTQQLHVSHGMKNVMNPLMNVKSAFSDESLMQHSGSIHGVNNLPLKGWPLTGLEQLQSGLLQQQSLSLHQSQPSQQHQLQQQIRMLLGDQYVRRDIQPHLMTNIVPDANLPVQVGLPLFSRTNDALMKIYQQELSNTNQSQQQSQRPTAFSQWPEEISQQEKVIATSNSAMDVAFSNTSRDNNQNQALRKRKGPMSSGPTNSSGTANTNGPSQCSAPSSPSTQTMGDVISVPPLLSDDGKSRAQLFCTSGADKNASSSNQMADIVRYINHGSVDDNVESFLNENVDTEDVVAQCLDVNKDATFLEIGSIEANTVNCCDFSSEGKLIATGGDDNKVVLWCTESREKKCILEEHSDEITDVRFSPMLPWLASCSLDGTIKIWDVHNSTPPKRTFTGHSAPVTSVDFHPTKDDLMFSCDDVSAIRYWTIKNGGCAGVTKVGASHVRCQPSRGRFLAAAVGNSVSLVDVETIQTCRYPLMGHASNVKSLCWNSTGEYLASLSEDSVRVWKVDSGDQNCVHELSVPGKRLQSCSFHPSYPSLLVIGSHQSMDLWHMTENKMLTILEQPISTLAVSPFSGLLASVSVDNTVKLWK